MARWLTWSFCGVLLVLLADGQFLTNRMDLTFIVDGSGSIHDRYPNLWEPQLNLIIRILGDLTVSRDAVRVAMVTFTGTATVRWNLDRYSDRISNLNAIRNLTFSGGQSNIYQAIKLARTSVFGGSPGDRQDVRDVIIIFSDGIATREVTRTETEAQDARSDGITMFSIAIGNFTKPSTLNFLASSPDYSLSSANLTTNRLLYSAFIARLGSNTTSGQDPPNADPCSSSPCMNNGECSREDPYGWGFYCHCNQMSGGRLCQIMDPCSTLPCPLNTRLCWRSTTNDIGRFCYDINFVLIT